MGTAEHGRTRAVAICALAATAALVAGACLPGSGPPLDLPGNDAGTAPPTSFGDASMVDEVSLGPAFAVTGLQPAHGPWTGGTRTTIAGRGFSSNLTVSFGGVQLPSSDVFASDPTHVAATTPPGSPGPVDVSVHDVQSAQDAVLPMGFVYDAFAVTPGTGSTSGGTRIALYGKGTAWTAASTVSVGGKPCTPVTFTDPTDLTCITPANDPGSQSVLVANADGTSDEADDAFVYSDSPDGYRGGLYGGALAGTMNVLAFDAYLGTPLAGAQVILGSSLAGAVTGTIGANGAVAISAPSLQGTVTVTVAAHCHQPTTYVDVPVDTVTVYLTPTFSYSCLGDPQSTGNYIPADEGEIDGNLVWQNGLDIETAGWANVPDAGAGGRQAAYVFTASTTLMSALSMPSPSSAVTPASGDGSDYPFTIDTLPGNQTVYALAGIETTVAGTTTFEPFVMGVARGVQVQPNVRTVGVPIPMTTLLTHTVTTAPQPPAASPYGPDRLVSNLAIDVGAGFYALLPQGQQVNLLPAPQAVPFVAVPALDGTLAGARYALAAAAVTGPSQGLPLSVVTGVETTDSNDTIAIGGFFDIPALDQPPAGTWNGTQVQLQASGPVDLAEILVSSGHGLVAWTIVAPGTDLSFTVPDLAQVPGVDSLVHGPITTTFAVARINGFSYGQMTSGQLSSSAWSAYAEDSSAGSY